MHLSHENEVVLEWRQGIRVTRARRKKVGKTAGKPRDYKRRPVPKATSTKRKRVTWSDEELARAAEFRARNQSEGRRMGTASAAHADTALSESVPRMGEGESITFEVHMRREIPDHIVEPNPFVTKTVTWPAHRTLRMLKTQIRRSWRRAHSFATGETLTLYTWEQWDRDPDLGHLHDRDMLSDLMN